MNDFFQKVPWDNIAMISDVDQAHFSDGRVSPNKFHTTLINDADQSLPDETINLVSFTGEKSLPNSWPLATLRAPAGMYI
jgi:hypothetical protein